MTISHSYWCLLGQEWQFHIATDVYWVENDNIHIATEVYWVKNGNFTLLLTSSGQEWQFHIATDVYWVKNGNFNFKLLTDI